MSEIAPIGPLMAKVIHQDERYLNDDGQLVAREDAAIHKFDDLVVIARKVFGDEWSTKVQFVPPTCSENAKYIGRLGGKIVSERKLAHLKRLHRRNSKALFCWRFHFAKLKTKPSRTFYVVEETAFKARQRMKRARVGTEGGTLLWRKFKGLRMRRENNRIIKISQMKRPGLYERINNEIRKLD